MAARKAYHQLTDGEWFSPFHRGFKDMCCDCGLVHTMDFRFKDGRIEFRARRDERATAGARRKFKFNRERD